MALVGEKLKAKTAVRANRGWKPDTPLFTLIAGKTSANACSQPCAVVRRGKRNVTAPSTCDSRVKVWYLCDNANLREVTNVAHSTGKEMASVREAVQRQVGIGRGGVQCLVAAKLFRGRGCAKE